MGCCPISPRKRPKSHSTQPETELLETATACPICGLAFTPGDTHRQLNVHIDSCIRLQPLLVSISASSSPEPLLKRKRGELMKLSYERKAQYFRKMCNQSRVPWSEDSQVIVISRSRLLEDSVNQLADLTAKDFHKEFAVHFEGEIGQDAGGLFKEWLSVITQDLFSKDKRLFTFADSEGIKYKIDPASTDLKLLSFTGKILAKALYENVPINCPLSTPLYRQLSGVKVKLVDLRELDKDLFESLQFVKNNNIEGVTLDAFTVVNWKGEVVELKPGGANETVTESNKREYVRLRKRWEVKGAVSGQLEAFLSGFHMVVGEDLVSYFEPGELELLMCGLPAIDSKEWEEYTEYRGEFSPAHQVVIWFWETVHSMPSTELSKLLMFAMGTPRLPVEGFRTLKTLRGDSARFTLQPVPFDPNSPYPKAHTCFNRVDLPLYPSKPSLQKYLTTALSYSLGFGLE